MACKALTIVARFCRLVLRLMKKQFHVLNVVSEQMCRQIQMFLSILIFKMKTFQFKFNNKQKTEAHLYSLKRLYHTKSCNP